MAKKIRKSFLKPTKSKLFFGIGLLVFITGNFIFMFYKPNYNGTSKSVILIISSGETFNSIVDSLYEKNIIHNKFYFKVVSHIYSADRNIKAGNYEIPDGTNYKELLKILIQGKPKGQKLVTIQEGIWHEKLAALLQDELGISAKKFMKLSNDEKFIKSLNLNTKSLEGYLLPETYYFYKGISEEDIIKKLSNEVKKIFEQKDVIDQLKLMNMNQNQILTMASIIDGESNDFKEFGRIAGVYYNRLRKNWKLQADPTIQYILRKNNAKVNQILYKDLEIDSKFNTYMYYGLPPAPINNPGKEAIIAAIFPEENNYFYFVADGKGGHVFSESSTEHERQVNRYRIWRENNK
ncbi:MAG: endolytic transglycosylase MltG [Ignavibacteriales bacterium]|nr:endolytic transglycosylase MltG [Ignavibacteriales bacterium]